VNTLSSVSLRNVACFTKRLFFEVSCATNTASAGAGAYYWHIQLMHSSIVNTPPMIEDALRLAFKRSR